MPMIGDRPEVTIDAVIYATDFSPASEKAGAYARLMADFFSAHLIVTHAFLLEQAAREVEMARGVESRQREHLSHLLAQRAAALASPRYKVTPVLLEGIVHQVIPALAETWSPSLLVLGTHGAGPLEHGLLGSTAEQILRSTRWPCMTVGPLAPQAPPSGFPFRKILFATDLGPTAAQGAMFALAFAEEAGADLHVLNAVPAGDPNSPLRAEIENRYRRQLERLVPGQARNFCNPHTYVEIGTAHDRILGHIREYGVDLLVLGIHKASILGLTMRTSGAYRVIAHSPCPVMTLVG